MPCYQNIFFTKKFRQIYSEFADDQGTFCLVFAFIFTSWYNSYVLRQFGMLGESSNVT